MSGNQDTALDPDALMREPQRAWEQPVSSADTGEGNEGRRGVPEGWGR